MVCTVHNQIQWHARTQRKMQRSKAILEISFNQSSLRSLDSGLWRCAVGKSNVKTYQAWSYHFIYAFGKHKTKENILDSTESVWPCKRAWSYDRKTLTVGPPTSQPSSEATLLATWQEDTSFASQHCICALLRCSSANRHISVHNSTYLSHLSTFGDVSISF